MSSVILPTLTHQCINQKKMRDLIRNKKILNLLLGKNSPEVYCETLGKPKSAIQSQEREKQLSGVILLRNNQQMPSHHCLNEDNDFYLELELESSSLLGQRCDTLLMTN